MCQKLLTAGLRPDPLEELTALVLSQTAQLYLRDSSRDKSRGWERQEGERIERAKGDSRCRWQKGGRGEREGQRGREEGEKWEWERDGWGEEGNGRGAEISLRGSMIKVGASEPHNIHTYTHNVWSLMSRMMLSELLSKVGSDLSVNHWTL